jgi:class 3 adenylate cyclase/tetratricopeptide (TPR) repeat protein
MSDVDKWLIDIGLAHLAQTFARAEIDFDGLKLVTDQDLREMRIPLGPRRKLLAALAAMDFLSPTRPEDEQNERRQLTILFCDMVDSTRYAAQLDPEDFSELTQHYLARRSAIARSHGGFVANYVGDALQVLFGYPLAEQDDAERALALAHDLVEAVPRIEAPYGIQPQVRIGIASGLVVVGDVKGAPQGVSTVAFGPVPNLAQRLQSLAAPQAILVDQNTYASVRHSFGFHDLGAMDVKGFVEPTHVWHVGKPVAAGSRFGRAKPTRLVARRKEIEKLLGLWHQVSRDGAAAWLALTGEPGIGKSRILFETAKRLPAARVLTVQCNAIHSDSALFPFLQLFRQQCHLSSALSADEAREKLEALMAESSIALAESMPIMTRLLAIDPTGYPRSTLTSTEQQTIVRKVFVDWLCRLAVHEPLLLAIEDMQWMDPSSVDLLDVLHQQSPDFPALVLITTRNSSVELGRQQVLLETIPIERLTSKQASSLLESVASGMPLLSDIHNSVLSKAEGVPLYLEELARSALDSAASDDEAGDGGDAGLAVPNNLQSAMLARLDRLGEGKRIAQIAAVIGREFDIAMLAQVANVSVDALTQQLERLAEMGLVAPQAPGEPSRYAFSHILIQEAARGTLLRERRRQLHARVAGLIEETRSDIASEHPEILAQHIADAGDYERAADQWLAAGVKVGQTWAKVEAASMFAKGLDCLRKLPSSHRRDEKELRLELERGDVLYAARGYVTREGSAAYRNVMRLSEALGDAEAAIRALDGLFGTAFNSARFNDAEWAGNQLMAIGSKQKSVKALVLGIQFLGMCAFSRGRLQEARAYFDRALEYRWAADQIGSDYPSMSMIYLSWTLQLLGDEEHAIRMFQEAETDARQQTDYRLAACLGDGCLLMALRHDLEMLAPMIEELIPLARRNGFQLWENMAHFFAGWMMAMTSGSAAGLQQMRQVCDTMGEQEIDKTCFLGILAESYLSLGRNEEAAQTIEQALSLAGRTGERYFIAELLRLKGDLQARSAMGMLEAKVALRKSAAIARRQGAKTWLARTQATLLSLDDRPALTSRSRH